MLDIIYKNEYFDWLTERVADSKNHTLKGIQDAWILSVLNDKADLKIAEVGGGRSRILERLSRRNECWNIDKFEGLGSGPTDVPDIPGVKIVRSYMGDFNSDIPDNYFDVVFSISVVEHVLADNIHNFFADCFRTLKPGGVLLHAIDLYVFDEARDDIRIDLYKQAVELQGFTWLMTPVINNAISFQCSFASNSDVTMNQWNQIVPELRHIREQAQSVSIKLMAFKLDKTDLEAAKRRFAEASHPLPEPDMAPTQLLTSVASEIRKLEIVTKIEPTTSTLPSGNQGMTSSLPNPPSSPSLPKETTLEKRQNQKQKRQQQGRKSMAAKQKKQQMPSQSHAVIASSKSRSQRLIELADRVTAYYSRWPLVLAILAIALNGTAFALKGSLQWLCATSSTVLLLFLIGHAASKADYALSKLETLDVEHQQAILALKAVIKRLRMRKQKRANKKHEKD